MQVRRDLKWSGVGVERGRKYEEHRKGRNMWGRGEKSFQVGIHADGVVEK